MKLDKSFFDQGKIRLRPLRKLGRWSVLLLVGLALMVGGDNNRPPVSAGVNTPAFINAAAVATPIPALSTADRVAPTPGLATPTAVPTNTPDLEATSAPTLKAPINIPDLNKLRFLLPPSVREVELGVLAEDLSNFFEESGLAPDSFGVYSSSEEAAQLYARYSQTLQAAGYKIYPSPNRVAGEGGAVKPDANDLIFLIVPVPSTVSSFTNFFANIQADPVEVQNVVDLIKDDKSLVVVMSGKNLARMFIPAGQTNTGALAAQIAEAKTTKAGPNEISLLPNNLQEVALGSISYNLLNFFKDNAGINPASIKLYSSGKDANQLADECYQTLQTAGYTLYQSIDGSARKNGVYTRTGAPNILVFSVTAPGSPTGLPTFFNLSRADQVAAQKVFDQFKNQKSLLLVVTDNYLVTILSKLPGLFGLPNSSAPATPMG